MDIQEAERRYAELKRQFEAGTLGAAEFNAQRQQLMVQDDEGHWWAKSPDNDEWNYYDGSAWVPGTPPGRKDDLQEAEHRYAELKRQFEAGIIGAAEFNTQRQQLMVQDDEGHWWAKSPDNDEWNYYDGSAWVPGTPPGYQEVTSEPTNSPAQTLSPPHPKGAENGENGRQKMPLWIPVVGLGGIALVGIVLFFWALVPYLQGRTAPGEQGEPMQSNQAESTPGGPAFDVVFVHRATPEDISDNSTYLDDPLTNNNPDAILYVTQNWNPGDNGGTYNDHPIGVWYDSDRQRWAIFNQDREAMPDGAAFNVAVSEEPTKTR